MLTSSIMMASLPLAPDACSCFLRFGGAMTFLSSISCDASSYFGASFGLVFFNSFGVDISGFGSIFCSVVFIFG